MPKPAAAAPSPPRRRRWKIAKARLVLAELAASGLSLREFASEKGLEPQRLLRWQRKLAREVRRPARAAGSAVPAPPALIELRPTASARSAPPVEIVLVSGVIVRVPDTIDPATLARLVAALERGC